MARVVDRRAKIHSDRRECTLFRKGDATALARVFVRHFLSELGRQDLVDAGELCVSELVSNSIKHTDKDKFVLWMYPNDSSPLFEVWDGYSVLPTWPPKGGSLDLSAENGRGLWLVQSLSKDCGALLCNPIGAGGKFVWFRL